MKEYKRIECVAAEKMYVTLCKGSQGDEDKSLMQCLDPFIDIKIVHLERVSLISLNFLLHNMIYDIFSLHCHVTRRMLYYVLKLLHVIDIFSQ